MNKEYFRITCEGIGIYEYLKKYLWNNISNPSEVWDNFIIQIGDIQLEGNNSVEEQVALDNKRQELTVKIEVLKRRIYKEKQARRKYDLNKELKQLIAELE